VITTSCAEGSGGPGVESCKDSNGASEKSGALDTSTVGPHTYTVTAKSEDGETGTASVTYTVVAPAPVPVAAPVRVAVPVAAAAPLPAAAPAQSVLVDPKVCVSERKLTIHVARHMNLPPGEKIKRARVLVASREVAELYGSDPVVTVSLVGFGRGAFEVFIEAETSAGTTRTMSLVLHTCGG
jgi:hypothetical protein